MFTIEAIKDDVLKDYPQIQEWIDIAKYSILKKDINEDKLEFYYSYGYFLPSTKSYDEEDRIKFYENLNQVQTTMKFDQRLNFELSKVRVNITMKIGNFVLSNRMPKGFVPKNVLDIVREITKVKMTIEGEMHENQEVINSIPEIDKSIVSFEIIKDVINNDYKDQKVDFDLDSILDKIGNQGIDSLSKEEKEFLDKKSKED